MAGAPMSGAEFQAATAVSRETLGRLDAYADLLRKWNRRINLVAAPSLPDLWRRHFLDSAQLLSHLPPVGPRPRVLVDLGSGAGFPGLVLAVLGAGAVHLIEANRRKAAFLREVARECGAEVEVHDSRIEDTPPFPADVVTARACAPLPRLLPLAVPFLRPAEGTGPGGLALFLKGRTVEKELTDSQGKWNMRVDLYRSRTDPAGVIVRLRDISKGLAGRDAAAP